MKKSLYLTSSQTLKVRPYHFSCLSHLQHGSHFWALLAIFVERFRGGNLENKKVRKQKKHAFDQESDQEKKRKKTRSRPRKRRRKNRKNDKGQESDHKRKTFFHFSYFLVFFYKFSPLFPKIIPVKVILRLWLYDISYLFLRGNIVSRGKRGC